MEYQKKSKPDVHRISALDDISCKYPQRSNSMDSSTIMPIYQQLQSKFLEFEEAIFPPLEMPLASTTKKHKPKAKKTEKTAKKESAPVVFSAFHQIESSKPHTLSATATFDTNKSNLGPGTYEIHENNLILGGFLSKVPRFGSSALYGAEEYFERKKQREKSNTEKSSTINISEFSKYSRLKLIKEVSKQKKIEENIHKRTKIALDQSIKEKRLIKYNEKISKFEMRMRRSEIHSIKVSWTCIFAIIGISASINSAILYKKHEEVRIKHMWGCFY